MLDSFLNNALVVTNSLLRVHPQALWALGIASIVMLFGTALLFPMILGMLPSDYFLHTHPVRFDKPMYILMFIVRNTVGFVFLLAGIAMLFLPGQGLLTIVLGLGLMNFPGKQQLLMRLCGRPQVQSSLNWLRRVRNKPEFRFK